MNLQGSLSRFSTRHAQAGFTLIELMVGLAISMLATVVIIQVISVFDAQRRTTTGSADAQSSGGIALHTITREAQSAGYPLFPSFDSPMECAALTFGDIGGAGTSGINTAGLNSIASVTLTDGVSSAGVSASDTVTIRYGSSNMGGVPSIITSIDLPTKTATIGSTLGCVSGDIALVSSSSSCAITKLTAVPSATTITLQNVTGAAAGANIACLGAWNEIRYAANPTTGNLERTSIINGAAPVVVPSAVGVVNIQAQYGISNSPSSNDIIQWVEPSGATWGASATTPTVANRKLIKAIRVAVVSRNDNRETANVTAVCSSTTGAAAAPAPETTGLCAWTGSGTSNAPSIDLSQGDANWQRYRYRVFETIIPLRNVIWAKSTL